MRIAFATLHDPRDPRRGSGTPYWLGKSLEAAGHEVTYVGPLEGGPPLPTRALARFSQAIGKRYRSYNDPFYAHRIGRWVTRELANHSFDLLLTNDYCIAGHARTAHPIALFTDAIFPRSYTSATNPRLDNLSAIAVATSQWANRRGLRKAQLCAFPTRWAQEEAGRYLPRQQGKMAFVPYGANCKDPGSEIAARRCFARVQQKKCLDLLFVGKDWAGKGGDVALAVSQALQGYGHDHRLHIVGSEPPRPTNEHVKLHGFLDPSEAADRTRMHDLYRSADCMVLPTLGEGFGLAAAEAAAYGMPVLAYDSVGINEVVQHGMSGLLLQRGCDGEAFAEAIAAWYESPTGYDRLVAGSRKRYEDDCNWEVAVNRLSLLLETLLASGKR